MSIGIKTADWSVEVAPFWGEVIRSAFTSEGFSGLLKAGWTTIKGALVRRMGGNTLWEGWQRAGLVNERGEEREKEKRMGS